MQKTDSALQKSDYRLLRLTQGKRDTAEMPTCLCTALRPSASQCQPNYRWRCWIYTWRPSKHKGGTCFKDLQTVIEAGHVARMSNATREW